MAISVITCAELYFGARDKTELAKIQKQLKSLTQVELDSEISAIFFELMGKYVLSHHLSLPDALIASTALRHDAILYTFNSRILSISLA
jgi:tRNA(fMet)-specific endonuclease VapC